MASSEEGVRTVGEEDFLERLSAFYSKSEALSDDEVAAQFAEMALAPELFLAENPSPTAKELRLYRALLVPDVPAAKARYNQTAAKAWGFAEVPELKSVAYPPPQKRTRDRAFLSAPIEERALSLPEPVADPREVAAEKREEAVLSVAML